MSSRFPCRVWSCWKGVLPVLLVAVAPGCVGVEDDAAGKRARDAGPDRDASASDGDWDQWDDPTRAETAEGDWDYWEGDPRDDEESSDDWDYWDDEPRPEDDGGSGDDWDYWSDDTRPADDDGSSGSSDDGGWCDWYGGSGSSGSGSGSDGGGSGSGSDGGSGSGSDGGSSGGTFEYPDGSSSGSGWSPDDFSYILRLGDNGQYYIIVKDAVQLDLAEDACDDFGGWLAYINDENELEDVYDMIYSSNGPYWATWIGDLTTEVKGELFSREQIDKYTLSRGEGWIVQNTNNDVYIGADPDERYHPFVCEMPLE